MPVILLECTDAGGVIKNVSIKGCHIDAPNATYCVEERLVAGSIDRTVLINNIIEAIGTDIFSFVGANSICGQIQNADAALIGAAGATAGTTVDTTIQGFQVMRECHLKRIDSYFKTAYADYAAADQGWIVVYDADAGADVATLELTSGAKKNGGLVSGKLSPGTNYEIRIRVKSTDTVTAATPPADGTVTVQMMRNDNLLP